MPPREENELKQVKSLQGMRFVAFGAIFLLHCFSTKFCFAAAWAVSFFLMLSGYLYGMKYAQQPLDDSGSGILSFTKKRIKKFYPLHLLMTLAILPLCNLSVIIATQNWSELWKLLRTTFFSLTLIQSWIPNDYHGLNGVSWFLSTIVFLYFMTPWLVRLAKALWKKGQMFGVAVTIILLIGYQYTYSVIAATLSSNYEFWLYVFPLARIIEYMIGILLGMWIGHLEESAKDIPMADLWITIVFVIIGVFAFVVKDWPVALWRSVLWISFNVFVLILLSGKNGMWNRLLSSKILVWLGNQSFAMYLIHQVIARYVNTWSENWDSSRVWKLLFCAIVFAMTILLSFLWNYLTQSSEKTRKS